MRRAKLSSALGTEPLGDGDFLTLVTDVFTIATGHPLRAHRCVYCGTRIGGQQVVVLNVLPVMDASCACGCLSVFSFLLCPSHVNANADSLISAAIMRACHRHMDVQL